jgi:SAM-dependent methyltransferase
MNEITDLIREIEDYCHRNGIAESTFGRLAAGNSKLAGRLRAGKGVTLKTMHRIRQYIYSGGHVEDTRMLPPGDQHTVAPAAAGFDGQEHQFDFEQPFRFYDNRQKYLAFVYTCNEKRTIAERVLRELQLINIGPPGLRVFDAGLGDGLVLSEVLRGIHHQYPTLPFFINGKEISDENVRLTLEKLPDRLCEHPATVLVISNMRYREAPSLSPGNIREAAAMNWIEVPLRGASSYHFSVQIAGLEQSLKDGWQTRRSDITGNPIPVRPSVMIIYREDHRMLLDHLIPRTDSIINRYDLIIASQPWRARDSASPKVSNILAPLARCLTPGGRLIAVQGYGDDPGQEILMQEWPDERPFSVRRHELIKGLKSELGRDAGMYNLNVPSNKKALLRYRMHTLPSEINEHLGTSTLFAAWNAAIYVGQIEDEKLEAAIAKGSYLESTRKILKKYGGLWFNDECLVISRRRN